VAKLGGCLEGMVPDHVAVALKEKFSMPLSLPLVRIKCKIKRQKLRR
jgi:hypothetical protein